jgi:hypothetical protein
MSIVSLRKVEDRETDIYPVQLLSFVTLLGQANMQYELFRLASFRLEDAYDRLNVEVPTWMRGLLSKDDDDR